MSLKKIIILCLLSCSTLSASEIPKLVLSAQATIRKPADELQLKIGVINIGDTAEETLAANSSKMQEVIAKLEAAGLGDTDYETGQFSIQPTYTPYPQPPPADWKPMINGYQVSNTLLIHTDQLHMAGRIIDLANKAGANSINDIRFGLHDARIYATEALTAAAKNAVSDAQAIATASGVKLVRVLSINLDNTQVNSPQLNVSYYAADAGNSSSTPIEPGEVKLTASITMVYEIASE